MARSARLEEVRGLVWEAYETARRELFARQVDGHWEGRLADSPLATAVAVAALCVYRKAQAGWTLANEQSSFAFGGEHCHAGEVPGTLTEPREEDAALVVRGLGYLFATQHADGGWGDTDADPSNIAATALAMAALRLSWGGAQHEAAWAKAEAYFRRHGGVESIRARYGTDKTFAAPILATCAVAGIVSWEEVPQLPFELAWLPQRWLGMLGLPVVSYALPALVAIGQLRFWAGGRRRSLLAAIRRAASPLTLAKLPELQPPSGGFLEAIPLTAFVVLSLSALGFHRHPVVERGIEFLRRTVRPHGAWPVDINLAHWLTALAASALQHVSPGDLAEINWRWLLQCQHKQRHPFTGSPAGGWGWTDQPGAVPDVDDTSAALLALAAWRELALEADRRPSGAATAEKPALVHKATPPMAEIDEAALAGLQWLLALQNRDGGWPTFCRGWGKLPFDRSTVDLTAHAIRAIGRWLRLIQQLSPQWKARSECQAKAPPELGQHPRLSSNPQGPDFSAESFSAGLNPAGLRRLVHRLQAAIHRGLRFLLRHQQADGSWIPLWFGNPYLPDERNPLCGTSRVLLALLEVLPPDSAVIRRGIDFLVKSQHPLGGWGVHNPGDPPRRAGSRLDLTMRAVAGFDPPTLPDTIAHVETPCFGTSDGPAHPLQEGGLVRPQHGYPSVEETAWAVEALAAFAQKGGTFSPAEAETFVRGAECLARMILAERWRDPAPVGLYFARLWYYEELYPLVFSLGGLGRTLASGRLGEGA